MKIRWWYGPIIISFLFFLGFVPAYRGDILNLLKKTGFYRAPAGEERTIILEITDLYLDCRHRESRRREVAETGLPEFFRELNQDRQVNGLAGRRLILTGEQPGLCPVCQKEEFIGVYQGQIAVYAGRPEQPGPVKELTSLTIRGLPEQEIADLEAGLVFTGEKEKLLILEAYSEEQGNKNRPGE